MKLPAQWSKAPLHQVAHVQTGLSKSQNRSGLLVLRPYLRVANVQDGYLDLAAIKEIEVPASQVERFSLRNGDVLLTEGGDFDKLGRGSIWNCEIPGCVHQNHVFAVRVVDKAVLLPEFLACEIQSSRAKNYFLSCAKQTTNLASINSSQLKELPVLIPPLLEQRAIINASAAWDTAIKRTEQLIAAKERHYSHEVSRLISRGKHPRGLRTSSEEVSACNRGGDWRTVALSDVATIWKGQQLNKNAMVEGGAYYALNGGIKPSGRTTEWNCEKETVTVSSGGNSCGFINFNRERFWCGGDCFALKNLSADTDVAYIFHYLKGQQHRMKALRTGSGIPHLYRTDLEAFPVILPDLATQSAIARYLNAQREEIDLLTQFLAALKTQKRGLMQKLLTGQWRLPVHEEVAAEA